MLLRKFPPSGISSCAKQCRCLSTQASTVLKETPESNGIGSDSQVYSKHSYDKITTLRKQFLTPNVTSYYKKPLLIHKGSMQWLYDHEGRRYLDMFGGIVTVSVGHCHPKVNAALAEQMNTLWHTTNIYMHPKVHEYAEKLVSKLPGDLKNVYFVNSGSEANDLAMLIARLYTGNHEIISFRNAYHGASPYTMGLTAHSTWRYSLAGVSNGLIHAMNPDPYTGIWGGKNCRDSPIQTTRNCDCAVGQCLASDNYYDELEQIFKYSLPRGKVAAMFAESIQGVGGTVQYPKGYIKKAAELVRANGGLFVADEVQSGFARTGEHYWGFEGHAITPDIVTMAKGIGNGFPIGAVVTSRKVAEVLSQALHFNTYGGNPLASAVGMAVLDIIDEEEMQKNANEVGTYLLHGLAKLRDKYDVIGDVRGKGLMIGVELVANRETRQHLSAPHFVEIWETCKDMGVLFGRGGFNANVLRLKPPLCVSRGDADYALTVIDYACQAFQKKRKRGCRKC
ncbi:alanine--glyoxylate aminotransferase 2, mitochondrial isoform X1 [Toxorhynchites rutilus septentrionalis]|uniref:alanine--glyoxylate aminotransferase 2, mitochondrial isoform X1 n=1 Tax=Toxorhynchites rutilus septentrionalis TaxID=329112 RepID=UPI00247A4B81|nr:alanine--glyoxylate aminotransferase 2, mitochondrial isoform X1 [Toxorhynchites rutilus septentrionalis]